MDIQMEFLTDDNRQLQGDTLLGKHDWDSAGLDDFLDIESNFIPDDLMEQWPQDLQIPVLDEQSLVGGLDELWEPASDSNSSDSGLDCKHIEPLECQQFMLGDGGGMSVKQEPLSPASSANGSDFGAPTTQMDFGSDLLMNSDVDLCVLSPEIKPEVPDTPPLTPQRPNFPGCTISSLQTSGIASPGVVTQPTGGVCKAVKVVFPGQQQPTAAAIKNLTTTLTGTAPGFAQVLNSKVKIQPKPNANQTTVKVVQQGKNGTSKPQQPLVLTQEEFAKLTAQGVLKFQAPTPAPTPAPLIKTEPSTFPIHNVDNKVAKRQQRMIKNRESACLSRKRKKEYLQTLEEKLQEFNNENEKLKHENSSLKRKIGQLEVENETLKHTGIFVPNKKTTSLLLGIIFLLSLNLVPLSSLLNSGSSSSLSMSDDRFVVHHGRQLMSTDMLPGDTILQQQQQQPQHRQDVNMSDLERTLNGLKESIKYQPDSLSSQDLMIGLQSMCPSYLNTTESQRLMRELHGWILGHSEEQQQRQQRSKHRRRKVYHPPTKLKAAMNQELQADGSGGKYEVQLFTGADTMYHHLLNSIHRRNDTFYVVSFNRDHLLLPAAATNKSRPGRPRMSLVMPAMGLNESMTGPDGSIDMMQIDCEVTATRLLHISETAIPSHLRQNKTQQHDRRRGGGEAAGAFWREKAKGKSATAGEV